MADIAKEIVSMQHGKLGKVGQAGEGPLAVRNRGF